MFWTFVDASQISSGTLRIEGAESHHLARVLRVRPGERGVAVSGGRQYEIEVVEAVRGLVVGRVVGERPVGGEATTDVTLLQAALPNVNFDAVIVGGTAVGIRRFIAVQAARSIARPDADRQERWHAMARSAAEQSHRGEIPEVEGPMGLAAALDRAPAGRLLALDPAATTPLMRVADGSPSYTIAVGPEGGWTHDELTTMQARGAIPVNMGPRILRASLAPVVAAAILVQQR